MYQNLKSIPEYDFYYSVRSSNLSSVYLVWSIKLLSQDKLIVIIILKVLIHSETTIILPHLWTKLIVYSYNNSYPATKTSVFPPQSLQIPGQWSHNKSKRLTNYYECKSYINVITCRLNKNFLFNH
jgi:hypothetical protein